jgi:hypothetical protein
MLDGQAVLTVNGNTILTMVGISIEHFTIAIYLEAKGS